MAVFFRSSTHLICGLPLFHFPYHGYLFVFFFFSGTGQRRRLKNSAENFGNWKHKRYEILKSIPSKSLDPFYLFTLLSILRERCTNKKKYLSWEMLKKAKEILWEICKCKILFRNWKTEFWIVITSAKVFAEDSLQYIALFVIHV